jgi:hypothetical protein
LNPRIEITAKSIFILGPQSRLGKSSFCSGASHRSYVSRVFHGREWTRRYEVAQN